MRRLISLALLPFLLVGLGFVVTACAPDECHDLPLYTNVYMEPGHVGVSHINVGAHVCFQAGTANLDGGNTQVFWNHSEYGAMQEVWTWTHVDMPQPFPRLPNGFNGTAEWLGGFHVAQCATAGLVSGCSFGTDFGCSVYVDPPPHDWDHVSQCSKVGGHNDFSIDYVQNANTTHQSPQQVYFSTPFFHWFFSTLKAKDPAHYQALAGHLRQKYGVTV